MDRSSVAELFFIAFLGGLITGFSPCIVPVLPVIVAGGSAGTSKRRPFLIIAGLVISFSLAELLGVTVLSALGLPLDFLKWLGIGLLFVLAAGLLIPIIGEWIEKPFARLGSSRYADSRGGFALGLSLGLVFVPCAGPVLAAISTAAANHRVNASSFFVTIFYAVGAAIPLLIFAIIAQRATGWKQVRNHLPAVRRAAGAVLALTTLAIAVGLFDPLQRDVPGYTSALQDRIESNSAISKQLQHLSGEKANKFAKKQAAAPKEANLPNLGKAPNFTGILSWFNTPGNKPLTLTQLEGKIVLIDFWTYSCINCQRALPHVEGWYKDYKKDGLVVVGVSTPEFAFEHVVSNVMSAAGNLGIKYPVAIDNDYGTWNAYNNEYWPAEYLIDQTGEVRAYDFGEGNYAKMESNIRDLLAADGTTTLPPRTDVANKTPTNPITQESYLGYSESQYSTSTPPLVHNKATDYHAPSSVALDNYALNGNWTVHSQEATAGSNASLTLHFTADDVYLVLGGTGTVDVSYNGKHLSTVDVSGVPRLYTLFSEKQLESGLLTLSFSPGVAAYDFTFG
ncbi:MAG TPA: cytochrome c biogenesis protein DipZ [Acidimicrobiales bacterium]|nr:cytochrome c biogenesis protein DipZ [Acidimicrobiales bacterium]